MSGGVIQQSTAETSWGLRAASSETGSEQDSASLTETETEKGFTKKKKKAKVEKTEGKTGRQSECSKGG